MCNPHQDADGVTLSSARIARVTLGFNGAEPTIPRTFNNGLAVDDIEFDGTAAPQCSATQPPPLTVNKPTEGKVVIEKRLYVRRRHYDTRSLCNASD